MQIHIFENMIEKKKIREVKSILYILYFLSYHVHFVQFYWNWITRAKQIDHQTDYASCVTL